MNCSNCGQPTAPDDVFCATCGADLAAQRAAAATAPPIAPPTPAAPASAAATPPIAPPPPPPGPTSPAVVAPASATPPAPAPAPAPAKKNRTLMIVLIILGVLLLLCSCAGVGGYLLYMPVRTEIKQVTTPEPADPQSGALSTQTYETPEDAVKAELPADWISKKVEDGAKRVVFWAGPPNSEFTTVYVVEAQADNAWRVAESSPLEAGGDVSPDGEAVATVDQFLQFVKADKGLEAQKLTVAPFRNDAAAAGVSNGQFTSYSIDAVEPAGDGSYFVSTTEIWKTGTDRWTYRVVPTDDGMRIQELMPSTK